RAGRLSRRPRHIVHAVRRGAGPNARADAAAARFAGAPKRWPGGVVLAPREDGSHRSTEENMARPHQVSVRFGDDIFYAAVEPGERVDQLLLRSMNYFGIDPTEKNDWRLTFEGTERTDHGLYRDHAIGDQVRDGAVLKLEEDVA